MWGKHVVMGRAVDQYHAMLTELKSLSVGA